MRLAKLYYKTFPTSNTTLKSQNIFRFLNTYCHLQEFVFTTVLQKFHKHISINITVFLVMYVTGKNIYINIQGSVKYVTTDLYMNVCTHAHTHTHKSVKFYRTLYVNVNVYASYTHTHTHTHYYYYYYYYYYY